MTAAFQQANATLGNAWQLRPEVGGRPCRRRHGQHVRPDELAAAARRRQAGHRADLRGADADRFPPGSPVRRRTSVATLAAERRRRTTRQAASRRRPAQATVAGPSPVPSGMSPSPVPQDLLPEEHPQAVDEEAEAPAPAPRLPGVGRSRHARADHDRSRPAARAVAAAAHRRRASAASPTGSSPGVLQRSLPVPPGERAAGADRRRRAASISPPPSLKPLAGCLRRRRDAR